MTKKRRTEIARVALDVFYELVNKFPSGKSFLEDMAVETANTADVQPDELDDCIGIVKDIYPMAKNGRIDAVKYFYGLNNRGNKMRMQSHEDYKKCLRELQSALDCLSTICSHISDSINTEAFVRDLSEDELKASLQVKSHVLYLAYLETQKYWRDIDDNEGCTVESVGEK